LVALAQAIERQGDELSLHQQSHLAVQLADELAA
jgi:hypothetical protein